MLTTIAWNNIISVVLFLTMGATLFGTIGFYATYKIREKKAAARRRLQPAPTASDAKVERPKIRFG